LIGVFILLMSSTVFMGIEKERTDSENPNNENYQYYPSPLIPGYPYSGPGTYHEYTSKEDIAREWENYSHVQTTDDWALDTARPESEGLYTTTRLSSGGIGATPNGGVYPYTSYSTNSGSKLGFSTGGAKDINNFRENIRNNYLPLPTDVTYEGLFYDYYFDTGMEEPTSELFYPSYSCGITRDPFSSEEEYYMSVGLKSGMRQEDFQRKDLNVVVVLDISGSMGSSFSQYYYDQFGNNQALNPDDMNKTKMEVATESVVTMLDHLYPTDRFGLVLFNNDGYLARPLNYLYETELDTLKAHILNITDFGGTHMSAGMHLGTTLFENYTGVDQSEYENRIIFLTDAQPNIGVTNKDGLYGMVERNAENKTYTTFIGIGVDFNTELTEHITKVRGANYYSVHSPDQFIERMDEGFDYMVTPLIFGLNLVLTAPGYEIEVVYGSPEADQATGEIMRVNTLFPSRTVDGQTKGGLVLLKLSKTAPVSEMVLAVTYENRQGIVSSHEKTFSMSDNSPEYFENSGIRKGVLLSRYADLLKNWLVDEREAQKEDKDVIPSVTEDNGIVVPSPTHMLNEWERQSMPLRVSEEYRSLFEDFAEYFQKEMEAIGDDTLSTEYDVLTYLINYQST